MSVPTAVNALAEHASERLRGRIKGRVVSPTDPEFDSLRGVFLGGVDPRPALIVRVADADDVAEVIATARETGLPLAVRSGGHGGAAHGSVDGGIVLDVRGMNALTIDQVARTAWAETGLTAAEVTAAAAEHGLAIGFGDTGSVGIGGITLGGGVGYLGRKHGLTIDNLLAAELVTADGRQVRADADTNPDLFWAIRGGGGNFGVATRFLYRLQEVPSVVGGILILPATTETVAGFIAAAEAAPDELSTIANVMPAPPMPFLAEEHHGALVILAMVAYAGANAAGERVLAPFRALAEPLADLVRPIPYPEMFPPDEGDYHPLAISQTLFVDTIDRPVAETIMAHLEASDADMRVAQLRVLGGAIARVPSEATAYAHRTSRIMVNVASFYKGDADKPIREAWVEAFVAALDQGDHGAYVNFLDDEGADRVRDAYPGATWDRLASIKATWDPTNLFRRNQNIPPASNGHAPAEIGGPMRFHTTILQGGKTATGIEIPADVVESLGAGKRPAVRVTLNGYAYRSTVATVDGRFMVGVSSEHRAASGLAGGDEVDVDIELDTEPREVSVPADFAAALAAEPTARQAFEKLSNSNKGWHTSQIEGAKTDETRQRRIAKSIEALREGRVR